MTLSRSLLVAGVLAVEILSRVCTLGQTLNVLYSFTLGDDGGFPVAGVVRDATGNLYGTAAEGGGGPCLLGCGVVFKLDPAGHQTVLHAFQGPDGYAPESDLVLDSSGNLYGTTLTGGSSGSGVIFRVTVGGDFTDLHDLDGGAEGTFPSGLTRDSGGNLYGPASIGGDLTRCHLSGCGVLFRLDPAGNFTVLHTFKGFDGKAPQGTPFRDSRGNLYGSTSLGGIRHTEECKTSCGEIYQLRSGGAGSVLHKFTGSDGESPRAEVFLAMGGSLYGTTPEGGLNGHGVVFKLNRAGYTVLYNFRGKPDGDLPLGGMVSDAAGNLYGVTETGGASNAGTIFRLAPTGKETVLYSFTGTVDGGLPEGGLIRDTQGNFYGTASMGGANTYGAVFQFIP